MCSYFSTYPGALRVVSLTGLVVLLLQSACTPEVGSSQTAELQIGTILGNTANSGFRSAVEPREFVFPLDHGAHPAYRSEWWYFTMVLEDSAGAEYGAQFTLFRQAIAPERFAPGPWGNAQMFLGHLAVTDVARGEHRHAQRFARGHPQLAGVRTVPGFSALIEDWTLTELDATTWALDAADHAAGFALNLQLEPTERFVLQGEGGLSRKGPGSASYYYSQPRMLTTGKITIDERVFAVTGLSWLDREWSTSVLEDYLVGWDWFALQLDDGRSLMMFQLRRRDGQRDAFDHGMLIDGVRHTMLSVDDFSLEPVTYWRDREGTDWPIGWHVRIWEERYDVHALVPDQLMDTSIVYWEGIVGVTDENDREAGRGYLELTGYRTTGGRGG